MMSHFYSPDGVVLPVEEADKVVANSFTVIGIRGKDSVVLASDKIIRSPLDEPDADGRILTLDWNIGMAMAGLTPDGQRVARHARKEAASYRMQYDTCIPIKELVERVAGYMHSATRHAILRPFAVSVILASWDAFNGPSLYKIEPSGSFLPYYACASGRTKSEAELEFDTLENISDMGTEELVKGAGEIIYKSHKDDGENSDFLFEMGIVGQATNGLHLINPTELTELGRSAGIVAAIMKSSSSDDTSN